MTCVCGCELTPIKELAADVVKAYRAKGPRSHALRLAVGDLAKVLEEHP